MSKSTLLYCCIVTLLACQYSFAQNSVLVNFGSNACGTTPPAFSLIRDPFSSSPSVLTSCDLSAQLPNFFSTFIAYNPSNNKLYLADIRTGLETKIWVLDIGLPSNMACPAAIPAAPTYSYSYISNNFEFDNNGNLWSLSNYNSTTGQCNIDQFDVNTGTITRTTVIQFPEGNFPTTIQSGDIAILPNGRMFAILGSAVCRLYEITGYNNLSGNATANYLQTLPKDCFGIAYLNGQLEFTGMDFGTNCYYYDYDIAGNVLGTEKQSQNGQSPIDNTSLAPGAGCTKKLLSSISVNATTADLVYELYFENMGNTILNNVNITDELEATFGSGNVSNVSAEFVQGSNSAGLVLNPLYNGTSVTDLLNEGQNLPNKVLDNPDYYFKIQIRCRVSNLSCGRIYNNSAVARAEIGGGLSDNIISMTDSSNNGGADMLDPNMNGNAGDAGENVPTPFAFRALPVRFIAASASLINKTNAYIKWQVATPLNNADNFEIQFSTDGKKWKSAGSLQVSNNTGQSNWEFTHNNIPGDYLYYRIKETDLDGLITYSRIILLNNKGNAVYVVYPNPAGNFVTISSGYHGNEKAVITLYDAAGKLLQVKTMFSAQEEINTTQYPSGNYLLRITTPGDTKVYKLVVKH